MKEPRGQRLLMLVLFVFSFLLRNCYGLWLIMRIFFCLIFSSHFFYVFFRRPRSATSQWHNLRHLNFVFFFCLVFLKNILIAPSQCLDLCEARSFSLSFYHSFQREKAPRFKHKGGPNQNVFHISKHIFSKLFELKKKNLWLKQGQIHIASLHVSVCCNNRWHVLFWEGGRTSGPEGST